MKCSSGYWSPEVEDLAGAETAMLELVAERTRLADGLTILDLGCGWGSFALWAAQRYPSSRVVAVSNSPSETAFIDARAAEREIVNLTTHTADISNFEPDQSFDRIISIEVLEHLQNYESLLRRLRSWLLPGGRLFVHLVCHRKFSYRFEDDGPGNWMGRGLFAAGIMPASDTLPAFQTDLRLERQWHVNGRHYCSTARAWLNNLDANRVAATAALAGGSDEIKRDELDRRVQRWRIFLMACEEMFGFADCAEWEVCHYLFASRLDALERRDPGEVRRGVTGRGLLRFRGVRQRLLPDDLHALASTDRAAWLKDRWKLPPREPVRGRAWSKGWRWSSPGVRAARPHAAPLGAAPRGCGPPARAPKRIPPLR